jgi:hypothetical protein
MVRLGHSSRRVELQHAVLRFAPTVPTRHVARARAPARGTRTEGSPLCGGRKWPSVSTPSTPVRRARLHEVREPLERVHAQPHTCLEARRRLDRLPCTEDLRMACAVPPQMGHGLAVRSVLTQSRRDGAASSRGQSVAPRGTSRQGSGRQRQRRTATVVLEHACVDVRRSCALQRQRRYRCRHGACTTLSRKATIPTRPHGRVEPAHSQ